MLDDIPDSDDCDGTQSGRDSQALLNHTCSAGENSLNDSPLLEEVDLHGNCLTSLPSWLFVRFPFLCRVDASQNQVENLPMEVWACSSLVELILFRNRLSSLSCAQVGSLHLQMDGDMDQSPGTPASCASEGSQPSDVVISLSTTDSDRRDVTVHRLERWRDRIEVRPVSYVFGGTSRSSQAEHRTSRLKELDLSHNEFEEVPSILPCVAPSLERLNLSYNRLTRFGPVDCYPASLRLLDVSHNRISAMDAPEDCHSTTSTMTTTPVSIPTPSLLNSTLRSCYSPFLPKRLITITLIFFFPVNVALMMVVWQQKRQLACRKRAPQS